MMLFQRMQAPEAVRLWSLRWIAGKFRGTGQELWLRCLVVAMPEHGA